MRYKVAMVSLGCPKNQVDAEIMLAKLKAAGYEITASEALADVIIVNTCGFIQDAKQESIDAILDCADRREDNLKVLCVTGCLAERYRDEIKAELPEVDVCVGIGKNGDIAEIIGNALKGKKGDFFGEKDELPLNGERLLGGIPYSTYIKIAEGCNNQCAFCAIPKIRGKFRSRPLDDIVKEATELANRGVSELTVVAQDTTSWGIDIYGKPSLYLLLDELSKIEKLHWIRVLYAYPDKINDELLDCMANNEKIVKYLDIPIQHCSENVLRAMRRPGNKKSLCNLIEKIRKKVPGITLRTTLMAGFFGETEDDFCELCEFIKESRFDRLGCFAFSPEEDTPAMELEHTPDSQTAADRADIIMRTQEAISEKLCEEKIGSEWEVLCEGYDSYVKLYFGRSSADAPEIDGKVFFTSPKKRIKTGEYVRVKITDCMEYDLLGEIVL